MAVGMNARGQITGQSTATTPGSSHAFRWTPVAGMQDLGTLDGSGSVPVDINDRGQVAGYAFPGPQSAAHAFRWTPSGGMQDLGTLGGDTSWANAINSAGQVVGGSRLRREMLMPCFGHDTAGAKGSTGQDSQSPRLLLVEPTVLTP